MIRADNLLHLFWRRVRAHPFSELLALVGIAAGVALIFAVQVANTSVTGSAERVAHSVTGKASIQLAARGPAGVDEGVAGQVAQLDGVAAAAPVLEARIVLRGPAGRRSADLFGADARFAQVGSPLVPTLVEAGAGLRRGVALPAPLARALGVRRGDEVAVDLRGRRRTVPVAAVLTGLPAAVAASAVAIAPLADVQRLTGLPRRVSRVLVVPAPGRQAQVQRELRTLAGGRMDVEPSDTDVRLLRQAATPIVQATEVFAAISALVGLLFAFNAMLLTMPQRRRLLADVHAQGFRRRAIVQIVLFDALGLGIVASLVGLALGDLLSHVALQPDRGYLGLAFPLGSERVVTLAVVASSFAGGVLATVLAAARPLVELFARGQPLAFGDPDRDPAAEDRLARMQAIFALPAIAIAIAVLLFVPAIAIPAMFVLVLGMLVTIPGALRRAVDALDALSYRMRRALSVLAIGAMRSGMTRSVALAATGALAVFGSVAIEGAHGDLARGLGRNFDSYLATADLWVTPGGDENGLATEPFDGAPAAALRRDPRIASVREYRAGLVDMHGRRVWLIGRPEADRPLVPASELLSGDPATVSARLRSGGWATATDALADAIGVGLGDAFTVPGPQGPVRLRLAGTTTNLGWSPGTIIVGAADARRRFGLRDPTALEIGLRPGVSLAAGKRAVERGLGAGSALHVETRAERKQRFERLAHGVLDRFTQISLLVLIAAVLAMAAAMGGVLWQRRRRFADLALEGFRDHQVWRAVLLEVAVVVGSGCLVGAAFALVGQGLGTRWLAGTTGYPVVYAMAVARALITVLAVLAFATAVAALPGYLAVRGARTAAPSGE